VVARLEELDPNLILTDVEAAAVIGCAVGTLRRQRHERRRGAEAGPRFLEVGGNRVRYRAAALLEYYEAIVDKSYKPEPKWHRGDKTGEGQRGVKEIEAAE
jgi:hypothetical protein